MIDEYFSNDIKVCCVGLLNQKKFKTMGLNMKAQTLVQNQQIFSLKYRKHTFSVQ